VITGDLVDNWSGLGFQKASFQKKFEFEEYKSIRDQFHFDYYLEQPGNHDEFTIYSFNSSLHYFRNFTLIRDQKGLVANHVDFVVNSTPDDTSAAPTGNTNGVRVLQPIDSRDFTFSEQKISIDTDASNSPIDTEPLFRVHSFTTPKFTFLMLNPYFWPSPPAMVDFWAHPTESMLDSIQDHLKGLEMSHFAH
jgi:hypothetical protein